MIVDKRKKGIQRCPKCGSSSLYKRSRAFLWTEKSKGYYFSAEKEFREEFEKKSKKYRCRNCKLDFDNPVTN